LASQQLSNEKPEQSLNATALVHETYFKLLGDQKFESRRHFFGAAAEAMRRILVDRARAWQPVGGQLGTYTGDGRVHLWQPGQPHPTISFIVDPTNQYPEYAGSRHFAFSPDGTKLIAGTSQPFARVFDVSIGEPTGIALEHHHVHLDSKQTVAVDSSRDGTRLLTGGNDGVAKIWDAMSGKLIREIVVGDSFLGRPKGTGVIF